MAEVDAPIDADMPRDEKARPPAYIAPRPAAHEHRDPCEPPPTVLALPPVWPTYSAAEFFELQQQRSAIYLFASAALLVVQAVLLGDVGGEDDGPFRKYEMAHRVETGASFVAFFTLAIGLVSATSSLLQYQGLRVHPTFQTLRHRPGPDVSWLLLGGRGQPAIDDGLRRKALGARRLGVLADLCLGCGATSLATSVSARLVDEADLGLAIPVLVILVVCAAAFGVFHTHATFVRYGHVPAKSPFLGDEA